MPGFDQRDRVATKGSRHNSRQGQAFKPGNLRVATNADGTLASRAESAQFWDPCSTNRCLRPVTATHAALLPSSDSAATPEPRLRPGPGLSFGLIHPRPGPFTGGHPDRVCAVRGLWRTSVNTGQHCWKACWGQPLASSNLASSATSDQAIHQAGHLFWLLLRGRAVSFQPHSFAYIGINRSIPLLLGPSSPPWRLPGTRGRAMVFNRRGWSRSRVRVTAPANSDSGRLRYP